MTCWSQALFQACCFPSSSPGRISFISSTWTFVLSSSGLDFRWPGSEIVCFGKAHSDALYSCLFYHPRRGFAFQRARRAREAAKPAGSPGGFKARFGDSVCPGACAPWLEDAGLSLSAALLLSHRDL